MSNGTFWISVLFLTIAGSTAAPGARQAQRKADWLADGGDPRRTAWQRHETILTKDTVKNECKPDL